MNGPTIPDCLDDSMYVDAAVFCVRLILDAAKVYMDFIIFNILGNVKRILGLWYRPFRTSRSQGSTYMYSIMREYHSV